MQTVSIAEAARLLDVSPDTVRRRLRRGTLTAHKETTAQGFNWLVDLPDELPQDDGDESDGEVKALRELVKTLQDDIEARRREVQELHILLQQSFALLPAHKEQPWWRRLLPWKHSPTDSKPAA